MKERVLGGKREDAVAADEVRNLEKVREAAIRIRGRSVTEISRERKCDYVSLCGLWSGRYRRRRR